MKLPMKILGKFWMVLKDSSSTLIGEVGMLELSCGPTWASGEELLALVVFRVAKTQTFSNIGFVTNLVTEVN